MFVNHYNSNYFPLAFILVVISITSFVCTCFCLSLPGKYMNKYEISINFVFNYCWVLVVFLLVLRYDDAVGKLESSIEAAGKGGVYELRANARICHAYRMVRIVAIYIQSLTNLVPVGHNIVPTVFFYYVIAQLSSIHHIVTN